MTAVLFSMPQSNSSRLSIQNFSLISVRHSMTRALVTNDGMKGDCSCYCDIRLSDVARCPEYRPHNATLATWLFRYNTSWKGTFLEDMICHRTCSAHLRGRRSSRWQGALCSEDRSGVPSSSTATTTAAAAAAALELMCIRATAGDDMQRAAAAWTLTWRMERCSILQHRSVGQLCVVEWKCRAGCAGGPGSLLSILWSGARRQSSRTLRTGGKADEGWREGVRGREERGGCDEPGTCPSRRPRPGSARQASSISCSSSSSSS